MRNIYATRLLPALGYGAEITGFADGEFRAATAIGLKYVSPGNRGSSRPARLLLSDGAGLDKVACAAFLRFAQEIWETLQHRSISLSPADMVVAWDVFTEFAGTWRNAAGPIHVAKLEAARASWVPLPGAPFHIMLPGGARVSLAETPPAQLRRLFSLQLRRSRALKLSEQVFAKGPEALARVPLSDEAHRKSTQQYPITRVLMTGGLWTPARLLSVGYQVDASCALCGAPVDDVWHRLWKCEAVAPQRRRALGPALLASLEAILGDVTAHPEPVNQQAWLLFIAATRALVPDPGGELQHGTCLDSLCLIATGLTLPCAILGVTFHFCSLAQPGVVGWS